MYRVIYAAMILALLCVVASSAPSHADPTFDASRFSGSIVGAWEGPFFGAAASYQFADHACADIGVKRNGASTDAFLGASTDWPLLPNALDLLGLKAPKMLEGWWYGVGYAFEGGEAFPYAAKHLFTW